MKTNESELRALMTAGLGGDAAAYRQLLSRLSGHLRAYYKGRLARIGRSAATAEHRSKAMVRDAYAQYVPATHPGGYECFYQGGPKSPMWHGRRI